VIDENLAMPEVKGDPRAQTLLEKKLLEIIVKYSLYKDIQLETLFNQFRKANDRLDKKLLEDTIEHVKVIMDE
jgi:hypothetical protein